MLSLKKTSLSRFLTQIDPDDHKNKIKQQRLVWGLTGVADLSIKRRRLSLDNDDSNTVPAAA